MASVLDVAAYILRKSGAMTATKLQKLVYYSQAWHLVWEDEPLFSARIEAWANGPVAPKLYRLHRGDYIVDTIEDGNPERLKEWEADSIDTVLKTYGDLSGYELSVLTHQETPWVQARRGLTPGERGKVEITHESMVEYYGALV